MFKLARILYSSNNQPEPVRVPGTVGQKYVEGQPMTITNGVLCTITNKEEMPMVITMESKTVTKEGETVLCYAVTSDMIFSVPCLESPRATMLGDSVNLYSNDGLWIGVEASEGSSATVYDLQGAKLPGDHVLIRFI